MANPVKGEVAFECEGDTYKLVMDLNALCELEDQGVALADLGNGAGQVKVMRAVFWACLQAHHDVSLRDAGNIMSSLGLPKVGELLTAAMERGGVLSEGDARPQQAPAKRPASTSKGR